MNRPWATWAVFGVCLCIVLAAMAWISAAALRLEQTEFDMRREAVIEENVRLALWRMDSAFGPLVAQEAARPFQVYEPFYAVSAATAPAGEDGSRSPVLVPSVLLTEPWPYVKLHFTVHPDGRITSPQVPTGNMRDMAVKNYVTAEQITGSQGLLRELEQWAGYEVMLAALPERDAVGSTDERQVATDAIGVAENRSSRWLGRSRGRASSRSAKSDPRWGPTNHTGIVLSEPAFDQAQVQIRANASDQTARNTLEAFSRGQNVSMNNDRVDGNDATVVVPPAPIDAHAGLHRTLWVDGRLVVARRVARDGGTYVQGCWLDWPAIERALSDSIEELFTSAELRPLSDGMSGYGSRVMAALPVVLEPGFVDVNLPGPGFPVWVSLAMAWACVLLAAVAIGIMLHGTVTLSERRAAFVSAVTHEMRTPLTTFRMYTGMLMRGMVGNPHKQRHYLNTLRVEADRLAHLVDNVLSYARLERGQNGGQVGPVVVQELLDRVEARLADRARRGNVALQIEPLNGLGNARVKADPGSVEQILLNLVDNACKYGVQNGNGVVHIETEARNGSILLKVRDHGPGVSADQARRLFRPFTKSAQAAANSGPGVGLGLALSRRLARQMGGDLQVDPGPNAGACFILSLRKTGP